VSVLPLTVIAGVGVGVSLETNCGVGAFVEVRFGTGRLVLEEGVAVDVGRTVSDGGITVSTGILVSVGSWVGVGVSGWTVIEGAPRVCVGRTGVGVGGIGVDDLAINAATTLPKAKIRAAPNVA
jgi:hypothetical protein